MDHAELEQNLKGRPEIALAIAGRATLRATPIFSRAAPLEATTEEMNRFAYWLSGFFRGPALAHVIINRLTGFDDLLEAAEATVETAHAAREATYSPTSAASCAAAAAYHCSCAVSFALKTFLRYGIKAEKRPWDDFLWDYLDRDERRKYIAHDAAGAAELANHARLLDRAENGMKVDWSRAFEFAQIQKEWEAVLADLAHARKYGSVALVNSPLWMCAEPAWLEREWGSLKSALRDDQTWDIWFDWYRMRHDGLACNPEYELALVRCPPDNWKISATSANISIRNSLKTTIP